MICQRLVAVVLFAAANFAIAQDVPTPSSDQLEVLRSLPADQQEALLREFGVGSATSAGNPRPEFPDLTRERNDDQFSSESGIKNTVKGNDTIVISFALRSDSEVLIEELPLAVQGLIGSQHWRLDENGYLLLPGVAEIRLAGLDSDQIELRLSAEKSLADLSATVDILPLSPTGVEALPYFGYELFDDAPTSFAPATDVPVPAEYVIGPGDEFNIQYFGADSSTIVAAVSRDGDITLPDIGSIRLVGLTFTEARKEILNRIGEQKIGVRASVTLGELRSIRIFVLGDVNEPGSYVVSGLSTMTNALLLSGGITTSGTLRNVQLKRNGDVVGTLDFYDLLLRGDTRGDKRLLPGDVIFVPPVGPRVGIEGQVERPAFYELTDRTTAEQLVGLAGGFAPLAYPPSGRIERVSEKGDRKTVDADLSTDNGRSVELKDGDILRISPVLDRLDQSVELKGYFRRTARYEWKQGLRLSDLVSSPDLLKPRADLGYLLIRREPRLDSRIEVMSADLGAALDSPGSAADPLLYPRDQVFAFPLGASRGATMESILEELNAQAVGGVPAQVVSISGQVRAPGDYPLEDGMRISDLLRAGGGFVPAAFLSTAELTRYLVSEDGTRSTTLIDIDLRALLNGDAIADEILQPYDYLSIREIPEWRGQEKVTIRGEVRFPGTYPIRRGETLSSVIARAGGLTDLSFADGSIFTRLSLKKREEEQIDTLISRLEADLASLALQANQLDASAQQAFSFGQGLLAQLRSSEATGRLVIDLDQILSNRTEADITLRDGDVLLVPQTTQEVTVIGEVQYATSHLFDEGLDRADYLARSGGLTSKADAKRIYVVRANGQVVASSGSRWLRSVGGTEIRPGDTIVVPLDADRIAPLTLWSSVTQIVYNLAVAVAAVNSF